MIQSVWKNLTGLIPAEHLCVTLNTDLETKTHHQTPMTCTFHYMDKSTGTPPSLEEKKTLPNCGNKDGNIIHVLKNWICNSCEVYEMTVPICTNTSLVFGDEFLSQGLYLKSHRGVQLGLDLLGWVPTKYITFKRPKPEKRSLLKQHIEVDRHHIQ